MPDKMNRVMPYLSGSFFAPCGVEGEGPGKRCEIEGAVYPRSTGVTPLSDTAASPRAPKGKAD